MFERIHSGLERISVYSVWVGGGALLLAAIMVTLDVLSRKVFSVTMSGSDEIAGYVFAAATTWGYSYCLLKRANIRIDALYNNLSHMKQSVLDFFGMFLLLFYVFILTVKAVVVFQETVADNATAQTTLATPLWIPQLFWVSGLVFFLLTLAFITVYTGVALVRRDLATVSRIAGVRTIEEEMTQETEGTEAMTVHGVSTGSKEDR